MPELFKQFSTLDITADLYLVDWMLTLFSKLLAPTDLSIVGRIWDNFMLDGEIYTLRVALALL
jgi:TBC1 domain family member 14